MKRNRWRSVAIAGAASVVIAFVLRRKPKRRARAWKAGEPYTGPPLSIAMGNTGGNLYLDPLEGGGWLARVIKYGQDTWHVETDRRRDAFAQGLAELDRRGPQGQIEAIEFKTANTTGGTMIWRGTVHRPKGKWRWFVTPESGQAEGGGSATSFADAALRMLDFVEGQGG